ETNPATTHLDVSRNRIPRAWVTYPCDPVRIKMFDCTQPHLGSRGPDLSNSLHTLVPLDFASFDHHVSAGLHGELRTLESDVTVFLHDQLRFSRLDMDLVTRGKLDLLCTENVFVLDLLAMLTEDVLHQVLADLGIAIVL